MIKIKRVLISVSDKTGLFPFVKCLNNMGCEIISTGGTANVIKEAGIPVALVSDVTGFPEMLDGRVKTLHPNIHGGILALRTQEHLSQLDTQGIKPIDMVVVNLYPFAKTIAKPEVTLEEAIENIDIGGPTMIRSAAKNYRYVTVIVNPARYEEITLLMKNNNGCLTEKIRYKLACEAFSHTASYDAVIHQYLEKDPFPDTINLTYSKAQVLRYGENPHQQAAFYKQGKIDQPCLSNAEQLHGKELSYNNLLDLDSGLELVKEFEETACVIIKHNTPCGVAISNKQVDAYNLALATDPISAFGGIIAFNRAITVKTAVEIVKTFAEAIIAPDFEKDALEVLKTKKDLRLLKIGSFEQGLQSGYSLAIRSIVGGLLLQDRDTKKITVQELKIVSKRAPSKEELEAMLFSWKVCKHVKSNAIVLAIGGSTNNQLIGVGAGQMSRVDSVRIAIHKSLDRAKGSVMASDAFFPFRDGIDEAAKAGISAVIQPGGSLRDDEVIKAADEYNMAMVLTGIRHFRH